MVYGPVNVIDDRPDEGLSAAVDRLTRDRRTSSDETPTVRTLSVNGLSMEPGSRRQSWWIQGKLPLPVVGYSFVCS